MFGGTSVAKLQEGVGMHDRLALRRFLFTACFVAFIPVSTGQVFSQVKEASKSDDDIVVTGNLSAPLARVGDNIHVWLSFRNKTPKSIFDVRLIDLVAESYRIVHISWCPQQTQSGDDTKLAKCPVIVKELEPGQIVTGTVELRAMSKHETQTLSALVGWTTSAKLQSNLAVSIGENTTFGKWGFPVFREVVKDFALPLVIVLLGIAYQIFDRRRESSRQNEERRRIEIRQNQERELTQIAQTWNSMLPESHRLTTNYYMPVHASANETLSRLKKLRDKKSSSSDEDKFHTLFFLLRFERRMRHLVEKAGGFYFKDRVGEELVIECYNRYRSLYYWGSGKGSRWKTFSRMLDCIDVNETIGSFSKKLEPGEDDKANEIALVFAAGRQEFDAWLNSKDRLDATIYLGGFTTLLGYEMNRPYLYWYGQPENLLLDSETEAMLRSLGQELPVPGFSESVKQYLELAKMQAMSPVR